MANFLRQFFQNIWYWLCHYLSLFATLFQGGSINNNNNNILNIQSQNNLSRTDNLIGGNQYNFSVNKPARIFEGIGDNENVVHDVMTVLTQKDLVQVTSEKLVPSTTTTTEGNFVKDLIPKIKDDDRPFVVTSTSTLPTLSNGPSLVTTTEIPLSQPQPQPPVNSSENSGEERIINLDETNVEFPIVKTNNNDSREYHYELAKTNNNNNTHNNNNEEIFTWLDIDERIFKGDDTSVEKVAPPPSGLTSSYPPPPPPPDNDMNSVEGDTAPLPKLQDTLNLMDLLRPPIQNFTDRRQPLTSSLLTNEMEAEQNFVPLSNDHDQESKVDSTMGLRKIEVDKNVYELAGQYLPPKSSSYHHQSVKNL